MKNKLRIAIAGAGMVTRHHLIAWSRLSELEVTAIYNRNLEKALGRAKEFSIPKAYSNMVEMLEKEKPDALGERLSHRLIQREVKIESILYEIF